MLRHLMGILAALTQLEVAAGADLPGPVNLFLPDTLYAVPGVETNVYFDNVVLVPDPEDYVFDVTCEKGRQQNERWTFTPADADAGNYTLVLDVRDASNQIIASDTANIVVCARNTLEGQPLSALLIGDSLTHASVYSARLLELCGTPANPALTLIGSHVPDAQNPLNRHEGYGGWTAQRFATHYTGVAREGEAKLRGSPFLYPNEAGTPALDFGRYCREVAGGEFPDAVTIFLGCNDTFSATDETIAARIDEMFTYLDQLIAAIRSASPNTRIGLLPPVPPSASQDAFGASYANGQTRWQYKRNQHAVVRVMHERYGKGQDPAVSIVPAFTNLDCAHNYPLVSAPWSAQSSINTERQNDGVHPSSEGYRQIGDSIYCWLKCR
ncbi:MAG: hypothetical protein IT365_22630 [Candidatus Hydrogenedentes bacterium]|nr:hypothetical protein [Candidatus Hydrogenedentota bacterium]